MRSTRGGTPPFFGCFSGGFLWLGPWIVFAFPSWHTCTAGGGSWTCTIFFVHLRLPSFGISRLAFPRRDPQLDLLLFIKWTTYFSHHCHADFVATSFSGSWNPLRSASRTHNSIVVLPRFSHMQLPSRSSTFITSFNSVFNVLPLYISFCFLVCFFWPCPQGCSDSLPLVPLPVLLTGVFVMTCECARYATYRAHLLSPSNLTLVPVPSHWS